MPPPQLLVASGAVDLVVSLIEELPSPAEAALPLEFALFLLQGTPTARVGIMETLKL